MKWLQPMKHTHQNIALADIYKISYFSILNQGSKFLASKNPQLILEFYDLMLWKSMVGNVGGFELQKLSKWRIRGSKR